MPAGYKISERKAQEIIKRYQEGVRVVDLSQMFGVSGTTVLKILRDAGVPATHVNCNMNPPTR